MRPSLSLAAILRQCKRFDVLTQADRPKAFSRDRTLTVPTVIALVLAMVTKAREGYGIVLQKFWTAAADARFRLPQKNPVAASAFCVARSKLGWRPLEKLVRETASRLDATCGKNYRWKKRCVYAVDGSKLSLPRSNALLEAFGKLKNAAAPMVHLVTVFNVFARATIAVAFGRYSSGERTLVHDLLDGLQAGSILLFDRGFPGYPLFSKLIELKLNFVARVPKKGTFKEVVRFVSTRARAGQVSIYPRGSRANPITLRIVRRRRSGEDLILLTNLSAKEATQREVAQLYELRWRIETCFKTLKVDAFGENSFRSLIPDGIKQEICARLLFLNLSSHLLVEAAHRAGRDARDLMAKSARAALETRVIIAIVFGRRIDGEVAVCVAIVARTRSEKRKGRSFRRVSYRPSLRWNRTGKTSRRGH